MRGDGESTEGEVFRDRGASQRSLDSEGEAPHRQVSEREAAQGVAPDGETSKDDRPEREPAEGNAAERHAPDGQKDAERNIPYRDPSARDSSLPLALLRAAHGDVNEGNSQKLEAAPVRHGKSSLFDYAGRRDSWETPEAAIR
jgi:hypothetical protein